VVTLIVDGGSKATLLMLHPTVLHLWCLVGENSDTVTG
jgi:hypothetical protein